VASARSATVIRMSRLLLGLLAVLLLAGCGGAGGESGDGPSPEPAPAGGGAAAVELSGQTLDGGTLSVAELRGNVVFVNAWASW
jgi:hypothetical protein